MSPTSQANQPLLTIYILLNNKSLVHPIIQNSQAAGAIYT